MPHIVLCSALCADIEVELVLSKEHIEVDGKAAMVCSEEQARGWIGGVPMGRFRIEMVCQNGAHYHFSLRQAHPVGETLKLFLSVEGVYCLPQEESDGQ